MPQKKGTRSAADQASAENLAPLTAEREKHRALRALSMCLGRGYSATPKYHDDGAPIKSRTSAGQNPRAAHGPVGKRRKAQRAYKLRQARRALQSRINADDLGF